MLALLMFGILLFNEIAIVTALFRSFVFFIGIAAILLVGRSFSQIVSSRQHQSPPSGQSNAGGGN